jgi:hypothetical protein
MGSAPSTPTTFPLLSLPVELRVQIYAYFIPTRRTYNFLSHSTATHFRRTLFSSPLLQTSRRVRNECISLLAATNRFSVAGVRATLLFLVAIGEAGRASLTCLELGLFGLCDERSRKYTSPSSVVRVVSGKGTRVDNFKAVVTLLAQCTCLRELILYVNATSVLQIEPCEGYRPIRTTLSYLPGFPELRDTLRWLEGGEEKTRTRINIRWVGLNLRDHGVAQDMLKFIVEGTEWLGVGEACVPHGSYGEGADSWGGCWCR